MFQEYLIEQLLDNHKKSWVQFTQKLNLIKKDFINTDPQYISALDNFCYAINKGYAKSTRRRGYTNKWVIESFITIFDPLLKEEISSPFFEGNNINRHIKENAKPSLIKDELICVLSLTKKQFTYDNDFLKNHLSVANLKSFADILKHTQLNIEERFLGSKTNEERKEILRCGDTIGMLATVLYYLESRLQYGEIEWCNSCFRRTTVNNKYCPLHSPTISGTNNNYKKSRELYANVFSSLEKQKKRQIKYYQGIRELFNYPLRISAKENFKDFGNEILSNFIMTNELVITIVKLTLTEEWIKVSEIWDVKLQNEFPFISSLIHTKASSFPNWEDFVRSIRIKLDENIETENHPLWVLYELYKAEDWLKSVNELANRKNMEELIIELAENGVSTKSIIIKVGLKKSRVYQIIKDWQDGKSKSEPVSEN